MFARMRPTLAAISLGMACLCSTAMPKETPKPVDPAQDAQHVYNHLLNEYVSGKTGIDRLELLNAWSLRILGEYLDPTASGQKIDPDGASRDFTQAMKQHVARMEKLYQQVSTLAREGEVQETELVAARHLYWQATRVESRFRNEVELNRMKLESREPPESPKRTWPSPNALVIVVDKGGNTLVDGEKLSKAQLSEVLQENAAKIHEEGVIIKASRHVRHKFVSGVAKLCAQAECNVLQIVVLEKE